MRHATVLVLVLACAASLAQDRFSFVVLGDRTPNPDDSAFGLMLEEVKLLDPDFILCTGNLVEPDTATLDARWDAVLGMLAGTGIELRTCPGSNDIFDARSESLYAARLGRPDYSFQHGNAAFVVLDNSRWQSFDEIPQARRNWFRGELKRAGRFARSFAVMHRPYWRHARHDSLPDTMHRWFRESGIDLVITGHDRFYCSALVDSVRYVQVGPSGAAVPSGLDASQGGFRHYLHCTVDGENLQVAVIEPGSVRPVDVVTVEALEALARAKKEAVELEPVECVAGRRVSATRTVRLRNNSPLAQSGKMKWDTEGTSWRISPATLQFHASPGAACRYDFDIELPVTGDVYPLPRFSLPFRYAPGRNVVLSSSLPVRRRASALVVDSAPTIDGLLDDSCWAGSRTLSSFGANAGGANPVERVRVWVGFDSTRLYIAAGCRESRPDRVVADRTGRDSNLGADDHLAILLQPDRSNPATWFEVVVNPEGAVADSRCRPSADSVARNPDWNPDWEIAAARDEDGWTVEMACPVEDFGEVGRNWGINAARFQSRYGVSGCWQVPFEHDPAGFGVLER